MPAAWLSQGLISLYSSSCSFHCLEYPFPSFQPGSLLGIFPESVLASFTFYTPLGWSPCPCICSQRPVFLPFTDLIATNWLDHESLSPMPYLAGRAPVFIALISITFNTDWGNFKWLLIQFNWKCCFLFCRYHSGLGYAAITNTLHLCKDQKITLKWKKYLSLVLNVINMPVGGSVLYWPPSEPQDDRQALYGTRLSCHGWRKEGPGK